VLNRTTSRGRVGSLPTSFPVSTPVHTDVAIRISTRGLGFDSISGTRLRILVHFWISALLGCVGFCWVLLDFGEGMGGVRGLGDRESSEFHVGRCKFHVSYGHDDAK
jgi:hypothetical protein